MLERQESGRNSLDEAYEAGLAALHKDNDWHKPDGGGQWRANYTRAAELVVDAALPHLVPTRGQIERALRERLLASNFTSIQHEPLRTQVVDQWVDVLAGTVLGLFENPAES